MRDAAGGAPPRRAPRERDALPAWSPLRHPTFRALWVANVVSSVGTWVHEVGAAWLMTSLTTSALLVALVQSATALPTFLLALPAGALADVMDRRRLLLAAQAWMLAAAVALAAVTLAGGMTPWLLLALTFTLGAGAAVTIPTWQAVIPELVPRVELGNAVTLGSVGFNVARAVGPAFGGVVVAAAGAGAAFSLNALSFVVVLAALARWRREHRGTALPAERFVSAVRAGLRYVRHSPPLRAVNVRVGLFALGASALWALLPLVARVQLGTGAAGYGLLIAALGIGAVLAAFRLPRHRARISPDAVVVGSTWLFAAALLMLAFVDAYVLALPILLAAGAGWLSALSTFHVAAQEAVPSWIRGRALAAYSLVFFGALAGGSAAWGAVAGGLGISGTLAAAGILLALTSVAGRLLPLRTAEEDLSPSDHWTTPPAVPVGELERGPVLVTVEYDVAPEDAAAFRDAMEEVRRIRQRDGARSWCLFYDAALPSRHLEVYEVDSWLDHLRQHERVTGGDREIEARAVRYHRGPQPPAVSHFLASDRP